MEGTVPELCTMICCGLSVFNLITLLDRGGGGGGCVR